MDVRNMKDSEQSSIPYDYAGGKYGLADRYPVSHKRKSGVFLLRMRKSRGILYSIRIRSFNKNDGYKQVPATVLFMIEASHCLSALYTVDRGVWFFMRIHIYC
jgi:hypothetical protein